ncbi:MAG: hypothetical protein ACK40G_09250 [Cytophagaceae bacterium]
MKKIAIILILSFSFCFAFSQAINKDSVFVSVQNEFQNSFISDICSDFLTKAERMVKDDSLLLPQYHFYPHQTESFKRWVKIKYNIIDKNIVSGCIIRPEIKCFEAFMVQAIENKYGKGFFDLQNKVADSLDKNGMGYIQPVFPGSDDSLLKLIRNSINSNALKKDANTSLFIFFEISENGMVEKATVLKGSVVAAKIEDKDPLQIKVNKIFCKAGKWQPAKFLGKAVKSYYILKLE